MTVRQINVNNIPKDLLSFIEKSPIVMVIWLIESSALSHLQIHRLKKPEAYVEAQLNFVFRSMRW